ncbi:MAG TPA: diadenylate cyclase CdaA [Anaerolineales bacterium]|nr:diadenylate cyclase CdaA [Anaerolineales bacterium]
MDGLIQNLIDNVGFMLERLNWLSIIDLALVTFVFFAILLLLRDTQAMVLLRGVLVLVALVSVLNSLDVLPAFSWLVGTTLPGLVLAVPVIFAPEIRRALERLGRAGFLRLESRPSPEMEKMVGKLVTAAMRLSDRRHGALIVIQRSDTLEEYIHTGVLMDARMTPELLLQVFYPNTPLHDGAAIMIGDRVIAASCVMPLSASGVLTRSPERQMGLRHRAALGISEVSDAVVVVVSEETGSISIVHGGRMIRRLDAERLENILMAFFRPPAKRSALHRLSDFWPIGKGKPGEERLG